MRFQSKYNYFMLQLNKKIYTPYVARRTGIAKIELHFIKKKKIITTPQP